MGCFLSKVYFSEVILVTLKNGIQVEEKEMLKLLWIFNRKY